MRWIFAFLIAIFSFSSVFATESDPCESRLLGNRYFGAFAAAMKSGVLDAEDLAAACDSETPLNPLADETPNSLNSAARALFRTLAADPQVRAEWAETRARLESLRDKTGDDERAREKAHASTRKFINFDLMQTIPGGATVLAFTTQADGTIVIARLKDDDVVIERLSDLKELHRARIPDPSQGYPALAWVKDPNGVNWLYFTQAGYPYVSDAADRAQKFYRMDFDHKGKLVEIDVPMGRRARVHFLRPVSSQVLLARLEEERKKFFINVLNPTDNALALTSVAAGGFIVEPDGKLILPDHPEKGSNRLFALRDGRALKVYTNGSEPSFRAELDGVVETFESIGSTGKLNVFETKAGRILIAQTSGKNKYWVHFYEFGVGVTKPFFSQSYKRERTMLNWFEDDDGHPFLAVGSAHSINIVDPIRQDTVSRLTVTKAPIFFRLDGQLFAYTENGDDVLVYRMFTEPGK